MRTEGKRASMRAEGPAGAGERDTGAEGVEELAQAADALFYAMRRGRAAGGQSGSAVSPAQLALIEPLCADPELPVGRLAAGAGVSVPTATRMLQQLEARGLVSRRRSPADERQVLVSLTGDGRRELTAVRAEFRERQAQVLTQFTPAERAQLAWQLRRLAAAIAELDR
jgi:MarR family transcriptional regulator, organic hydroperoxide resistance regulator